MDQVWRFRSPAGPALRRAALPGAVVGAAILVDLETGFLPASGVGIGAMIAAFVAFDSPSGLTRARWQVLSAPAIAIAAAIGALTADSTVLAVASMTGFAIASGLTFAVSPRLYIVGLTCTLGLLLAQGLSLSPSDAPEVLAVTLLGVGLQVLASLLAALFDRLREDHDLRRGARRAAERIGANLNRRSESLNHALRWGCSLGFGVAVYYLADFSTHGYWVPLTILFVLRPTRDETLERIALRAAGTMAGLALATPFAELVGGLDVIEAVALAALAAASFAMLAIEYALFTAAITGFVVIYAHASGQSAFEAADERALATAIGLTIVGIVVSVWRPTPDDGALSR